MNLLTSEGLTLSLSSRIILRDLHIKINAGDKVGILGPNGSGKTTLLHCLVGLIKPQQGSVKLFNEEISNIHAKDRAKKIGLLFQDTTLAFSQSVHDFCITSRYPHLNYFTWKNEEDDSIVQDSLRSMELQHLKDEDVFTLSGGERRRLAIAALLIQKPSIYLLDEPTNHLDLRHQMRVLNFFSKLADNTHTTVLMTLHDPNHVERYCNKTLFLFGDGSYLYGDTQEILTADNLKILYSHPISMIQSEGERIWVSEKS